jgi:pimeloyl-ACP methyl ester carboxylesterase
MRRGYVDGPHGQMHYVEAGQGDVILLLHQTASSSTMWGRSMPRLAERYRVVAPDNPGFGLSDPPDSKPEFADYADSVLAVLDGLGIERAHAVGFHTGASIALELVARHPERTSSAVIAGILTVENDKERERWRELIIKPWEPDGRGEFLQKQLDFLRMFLPEEDGELFLEELLARLQAGGNYWWTYDALLDHPAHELVPLVERPVLVMNAVEDMLLEETKRLHAAIPGSSYVEIPGGVVAASEHPIEFADAVLEFLDGLPS